MVAELEIPALDRPYQVLTHKGQLVDEPPALSPDKLIELHRYMLATRIFSDKIIALQRQGRAGTFGSLAGQEATAVGLSAPLKPQDWLATSYREAGCFLVRGVPYNDLLYYFKGYPPDNTHTRTNTLPIQIVIGTQMLHTTGLALGAKIKGDDAVALGICGDGATSEGDFNESLNFAGVFKAPAILAVTNNGWAISTPRRKQSVVQTLALRGAGFGVPAYLVDGNDVLAVYKVMEQAVARARAGEGPSLIETITYRMGAHTTADDPSRYVPKEDLEYWRQRDPIDRFRKYLFAQHLLDEASEHIMAETIEREINEAVDYVEARTKPTPDLIFDITFEQPTPRMQQQREEMRREMREKGL
ncbi:MAG: thiamine pyrophosphate-dependent dehydrogenase E1 component subunit alpha [Chloroflexi bacterium]|uniref:2-oxoisovalerate dehydrogenase subunit alpha n=1 Tax=Candidatus Chlorohelix allophototropha TaxID=3003348 RepID=A0A8T7M3G8_9CHLR|nr:thiamine pyrophosphate-dependent dehydrogenase E1 component subunit alpha [Chloroflexota bacterium]WJW67786.1 thiamine pyrophosphate-dependent dehydrogenase E1 component subunit alpha [Chloroflexota bacterium L227-S17]